MMAIIPPDSSEHLYIGLMSGTSLDGIDGVLSVSHQALHAGFVAFPDTLRSELLALQSAGDNEIHRAAIAANELTVLYAQCVQQLLADADISADRVSAIGAHGQTIRHRPELGYTRQIINPALLAELTGIDVIADFRHRDIAAGGQGAPLVPAFHQAVFGSKSQTRVVANIGGISNISILRPDGSVSGYDTGPGNMLIDGWIHAHRGQRYDAGGQWAASGNVLPDLLDALLSEPYLALPAPKSTGRDLFNAQWLARHLQQFASAAPADVQATLTAFTARSLADAIQRNAADAEAVYVCGGGAMNTQLVHLLQVQLTCPVSGTQALGVSPQHVEALAFAWLAARFCERLPGNLPSVTGARGSRVLGALYPT
jgi:anhydro-N-acetylmuramic acid kinase